MVKIQPIFLLCLAHLSHTVFGAAVPNTENNVQAYRYRPDGSKIDIPRNLLKRGGGGNDDDRDGNHKGYGKWEVGKKDYKKSQDGEHGYYEDYDDSDNEWDHEFGFKSYYDGESLDEQGWTEKEDWQSELFNNAEIASCPALGTTTITVPGEAATFTVTAPGETVTSTFTVPASDFTNSISHVEGSDTATAVVPGETVTSTVVVRGETVTVPGETVTVPGETVTVPGETLTLTTTRFLFNTIIGFTSTILTTTSTLLTTTSTLVTTTNTLLTTTNTLLTTTTTSTSTINPVVTSLLFVTKPCTWVTTVTVTA